MYTAPTEADNTILSHPAFVPGEATEKRDILEVCLDLGIDLEEKGQGDRIYYTTLCPLHDDGNRATFVVYPKIQRYYCWVCNSAGGDCIDLTMRLLGMTYQEAIKLAAYVLPPDKAFEKFIAKVSEIDKVNYLEYSVRCNKLFSKMDFASAQRVLERLDTALGRNSLGEAEMLLRREGV